jgi:hypothetical protein
VFGFLLSPRVVILVGKVVQVVDVADKGKDWLVSPVTELTDEVVKMFEADETITTAPTADVPEHNEEPTFDTRTLTGDGDEFVSEEDGTVTSFMGTTLVAEDVPDVLDELIDDNEDMLTEVLLRPRLESPLAEIRDCCVSPWLMLSLLNTVSLSAEDVKSSLVLLLSDN